MNKELIRYTSRKFALTLLTFTTITALVYLDKISGAIFRDLVVVALGVYTTGNVFQKQIEKRNES